MLPCKVMSEKLNWSSDQPFYQTFRSTDLGLGFWEANGIYIGLEITRGLGKEHDDIYDIRIYSA